jgi:hypothetical protein
VHLKAARQAGGWIFVWLDSTRRQPSPSTTSGVVSEPRSVCTVAPSRPVTVAVSNSSSPSSARSHISAHSSR